MMKTAVVNIRKRSSLKSMGEFCGGGGFIVGEMDVPFLVVPIVG